MAWNVEHGLNHYSTITIRAISVEPKMLHETPRFTRLQIIQ